MPIDKNSNPQYNTKKRNNPHLFRREDDLMSNNLYFFRQTDSIRNSLKLLNVGSAKYDGDWNSVPHTHSYAELFYVIGGAGQIQIDQELFPISARQLAIINPNVMHTEVSLNASPLEYLVLGIEGLELSASASEESRFKILDHHGNDHISVCLQNILQETHSLLPGNETICQAYMEILVIWLMRSTNLAFNDAPISSSNNQCVTVRRYIDAHFKEPLTLDYLARIAHVNKYHLAHSFKEEFGISPISYQLNRRIEESCNLLRQTDMSLSQIARVLGFSSSSYFSQLFKKIKKMSPSEFRKLSSRT